MSIASDFDRMVIDFMNDDPLIAYYIKFSGDGIYNPSTGENVVSTVEIPVKAILLDLTLRTNGLGTAPNSLIQAGDKLLYVQPPEKTDSLRSPLVINPASDKIRIGTTEYDIVIMKESNPSGSNVILYELYLRK